MATDEKYDVFVSYKHNRHREEARKLVERLRQRGLRVWFDVDQLDKKEQKRIDKEELVRILTATAKSSRISVIFAAQLEAVALPPGISREDALAEGSCMIDENTGALIAWNWQKLEIDNSKRFIEVHPNSCALNTHKFLRRTFDNETEMLREVERMVMQYFAKAGTEGD